MSKNNLIPFNKAEEKFIKKMIQKRNHAEVKFPLPTALAATFGFVSVLYGFEKMIDNVELFAENPIILLVTGLIILGVTGSVYKKLN